jgi:hypothetical protein
MEEAMSQELIEIQGSVKADGTLMLDHQLDLPEGRVRVTVQPMKPATTPDPVRFQALMAQIWAGQKARGHVPRSKEEIDAEVRKLREEAEEEFQAAEQLHEAGQSAGKAEKE